jgi:hypothetical protein
MQWYPGVDSPELDLVVPLLLYRILPSEVHDDDAHTGAMEAGQAWVQAGNSHENPGPSRVAAKIRRSYCRHL